MLSEKNLSAMLLEDKLVTKEQLDEALQYQSANGKTLVESLKALEFVSDDDIIASLVTKFDYSYVRLKNLTIDRNLMNLVPKELCQRYKFIPISKEENLITIAMANPTDLQALDDLKLVTQHEVFPVIAKELEIMEAVSKYYTDTEETIRNIARKIGTEQKADLGTEDLARKIRGQEITDKNSPLIVQLCSRIIESAYYQGASDIHIEPQIKETIVRYRIDGVLQEALRLPIKSAPALVARLKIMSEMDIAEHRLPQDGRIVYSKFTDTTMDIDLRVSSVPVNYGEKICMRILDKASVNVDIGRMGYSAAVLETYKLLVQKPYGMILHVGPTGSGKSTALYASLNFILSPEINIQTAEDPIEYTLPGINQCQIKPDIGFTFARALRAFLRQDPDVILIGEIRDLETAEIGIEAALTGHLIFSTMHTNNAVGTVSRFLEMGIPPFLVANALLGVCAQRLLRTLCRCKKFGAATADEMRLMGLGGEPPLIPHPFGCSKCNGTGYRGRMGVHELLVVTDEIKHLINEKEPIEFIHNAAVGAGMVPLFGDGLEKIRKGFTSLEEVLRVVRDE